VRSRDNAVLSRSQDEIGFRTSETEEGREIEGIIGAQVQQGLLFSSFPTRSIAYAVRSCIFVETNDAGDMPTPSFVGHGFLNDDCILQSEPKKKRKAEKMRNCSMQCIPKPEVAVVAQARLNASTVAILPTTVRRVYRIISPVSPENLRIAKRKERA